MKQGRLKILFLLIFATIYSVADTEMALLLTDLALMLMSIGNIFLWLMLLDGYDKTNTKTIITKGLLLVPPIVVLSMCLSYSYSDKEKSSEYLLHSKIEREKIITNIGDKGYVLNIDKKEFGCGCEPQVSKNGDIIVKVGDNYVLNTYVENALLKEVVVNYVGDIKTTSNVKVEYYYYNIKKDTLIKNSLIFSCILIIVSFWCKPITSRNINSNLIMYTITLGAIISLLFYMNGIAIYKVGLLLLITMPLVVLSHIGRFNNSLLLVIVGMGLISMLLNSPFYLIICTVITIILAKIIYPKSTQNER